MSLPRLHSHRRSSHVAGCAADLASCCCPLPAGGQLEGSLRVVLPALSVAAQLGCLHHSGCVRIFPDALHASKSRGDGAYYCVVCVYITVLRLCVSLFLVVLLPLLLP